MGHAVSEDQWDGDAPAPRPVRRDPIAGLALFGLVGLVMIAAGARFLVGAWDEHRDARAVERDGRVEVARVVDTIGGGTRVSRPTTADVQLADGSEHTVPVRAAVQEGARIRVLRSRQRPDAVRSADYVRDHSAWYALVGALPLALGLLTCWAVVRTGRRRGDA